jgi:hypothetical protein
MNDDKELVALLVKTNGGRQTIVRDSDGVTFVMRGVALEAMEAVRASAIERLSAIEQERDALREALTTLVNEKALAGVRELVAGWNGESRPDGPYDRHPPRLGATLPKTTCGAVYELDEAMQSARAALNQSRTDA